MSKTPTLSLLAALVLAAGARPARAEEATHAIPALSTWKVGDVATRTGSEKKAETVKVKLPDGTEGPGSRATTSEVAYEVAVKVLEVDAKAQPVKALLHFASWTRTVDGKPDGSLAGAFVDVAGAGAARTVKARAPAAPSPEAVEWLTSTFGAPAAENEAKRAALFPSKPVAVGETWELPPATLVSMFQEEGSPLTYDATKAKGTMTLVSVKDGLAEMRFQATVPSTGLQTPGGSFSWTEGGALAVDFTFSKPLDPSRHESADRGEVRFAGVATMGVTVDIDVGVTHSGTAKAGGTVPEPAAAPAK
jgi:hypothetical protein